MYSSITIEGFRCFPRFELNGLDRINLLVGANNSGKTALLEAIALLVSKGSPREVVGAAFRRGEVVHADDGTVRADLRRIFHGHAMSEQIRVVLAGQTGIGAECLMLHVSPRAEMKVKTLADLMEERANDARTAAPRYLMRTYEGPTADPLFPVIATVDGHGGLMWSNDHNADVGADNVRLIPTGSLSGDELVEMISPLLLTDREQLLLEALRIIDDQIEGFRIAPQPSGRRYHSRECAIVKLLGMTSPIPIGSLGDGVWRLFTLATAMASAAGGTLLVDDIDTGLHYSIMEKMWRHVAAVATLLDVQVFATTHSRDCYEALSAIEEGCATIHRIERGRAESVVFGGAMVTAAAANDIEVR